MALISCLSCLSDNDIHLEGRAPDGSRVLRCGECGHTWTPQTPSTAPAFTRSPFEMARGRFATAAMVDPARTARIGSLKAQFLTTNPEPAPEVVAHWARYRQVFSAEGLRACTPADLKEFATNPTGAHPGNMSVFNRAWKRLGEDDAAARTRGSVEYLLRGPATTPVEDRLTALIEDPDGTGMPGFKESLLTKVLCIMEPDRFLPILTYGGEGTGKRDVTEAVYGLHLPKVDQTAMQIGRLATWSNDLLLELVGEGFAGTQHAASFLWWAKDSVDETALVSAR
ncbi:MAG TPA: hypothetical protein VES95_13300 [Dermatophilaceae bacterium]|nr:hypothetical protein [Dermatophilaceae bacterium]